MKTNANTVQITIILVPSVLAVKEQSWFKPNHLVNNKALTDLLHESEH